MRSAKLDKAPLGSWHPQRDRRDNTPFAGEADHAFFVTSGPVVHKKPGPVFTDPGSSLRVANPRQGDFAEPDQRFKGEGLAARPLCRIAATCR
jgi:hypothetical protein